MTPLTAEWVAKAEEDFRAIAKLLALPGPEPAAACFHCQQCLEKYLKARLSEALIPFPRTHDLRALLALIEPLEPLWASWRDTFKDLSAYAVDIRYPGEAVTEQEARAAFAQCSAFRGQIRASLGAAD